MTKKLNLIKRIILFFIGMSIIQIGVALFLKTNIGSDPFTIFTQGLAFSLNRTPGNANMIILFILFCIILLVERKRIKIGTIICVVGVGPIIDLGVKAVSFFPIESLNIGIKILLVILGCILISIGFSILAASNLGVAPNDIIPFIIKDKTNLQYRWIRMVLDISFVIMGFALGGVFGIGTIIPALLIGPFIQFCIPYGEKFVNSIINNQVEGEAKDEEQVTLRVPQSESN
ncbi:MAG: YczE/YyaS/YitT family protein [Clostridium sp.]|uniref:YczE/YyaS/YitT family protein n=1 Tax=Clostridium sp. TaxID=1506 RepID=UPI003D6D28A7